MWLSGGCACSTLVLGGWYKCTMSVDGVLKQRVESIGNYVDTDSRMRSTTVSSVCRLVPERAERSTGWCRVVWLTHCAQKPYMRQDPW